MPANPTHRLTNIADKRALASIMLVANPLVCYGAVILTFRNNVDSVLTWILLFSSLLLSALLGASLSHRIKGSTLALWTTLGVLASLALPALNSPSIPVSSAVAVLLGVSLGFGMPACMNLYTKSVPVENRGRTSGLTMLITGAGLFAIIAVNSENMLVFGLLLAAWRLLGLLVFLYARPIAVEPKQKTGPSYGQVVRQQSFILYFIPWVMFSLVNYLTDPLNPNYAAGGGGLELLEIGLIGVFAVLGGFLLDAVGRKRIAIAGFIMLGIGYAGLGMGVNSISLFFDAVFNGAAWGLLLVLFILTLWGDLSDGSPSDKYYAIGVLPFVASILLRFVLGKYVGSLEQASLFPFAAFFLFLAVLPLFYAPETLPEKHIREREVASYINKAQKIKGKYSQPT